MAIWTRQPQEKEGSYFFSGDFYATHGIASELSEAEVLAIYLDARCAVKQYDGIDYLQVYTDEKGRKLFFIDQLSKEMIDSVQFRKEDNYCVLMFAHEY